MRTVVVFVILINAVVSSDCPDRWLEHKSSDACYYFSTLAMPWNRARDYCQELEGELVEIENREENTYLETFASRHFHPNASSGAVIYGYWTGGTRAKQGSPWYWTGSNHKFTFSHWYPGEPNFGHENCVHVNSHERFRWNNYDCTRNEFFICEMRLSEFNTGIIG